MKSKEIDIRPLVVDFIKQNHPEAYITHELNAGTGMYSGRLDVVGVEKDYLIGFEIKSYCDNLKRLPKQIAEFRPMCKLFYVVADKKHLNDVQAFYDEDYKKHWGILSFHPMYQSRRVYT